MTPNPLPPSSSGIIEGMFLYVQRLFAIVQRFAFSCATDGAVTNNNGVLQGKTPEKKRHG